MAYAISEKEAADSPKVSNGEDSYVKELFLKGIKYYLYVHRLVFSAFVNNILFVYFLFLDN